MDKLSDDRHRAADQKRILRKPLDNEYPEDTVTKLQLQKPKRNTSNGMSRKHKAPLCIPFFSEKTNILVKNAISSSRLDIGLINKQGQPLHSRLAFQQISPDGTCTKQKGPVNDQSICSITGCVYIVTCLICKQYYVGCTTRPFHQHAAEHLRAAKNPARYKENALAEHYHTPPAMNHL